MKSAESSSITPLVSIDDLVRALELARPWITRTCCDASCVVIELVQAALDRRHPLAQRVDVEVALGLRAPSACARSSSTSSPPVAISAFDGMQSHRCAAPPTMSRSTSVTSAPRVAATVAQVLPAGPPPRITRLGMATNSRARPDRSASRRSPA